jgi:hypothetical protein
MSVKIKVNYKDVELSINRLKASMRDRKSLMDRIASALQLYTQDTIKTQGRGSWAPLAPSTKEATGRNKALTPLIPFIRGRSSTDSATVYFSKRPSGWSIAQHESGYTSPAVKGPIMKTDKGVFFSKRKASVVPARKIFPTPGKAKQIAMPLVLKWTEEVIKRSWGGR